jgi:multicomponent Na+:H+ antiporter subunit F
MTLATFVLYGILPVLGLAALMTTIRIVRGPTLADRAVGLDLLTILAVAFVAAIAVGTGQSVLLDIAFVVALVSFLGTVAFARYLERRGR